MLLLEDKIAKMVDTIEYLPSDFGRTDDCGEASFFYGEDISWDLERNGFKDIRIENGVTKCVIIDDSCSYVIKIPFNGEYQVEYAIDEDGEENWDDFTEVFVPFEKANDINEDTAECWDYCGNELFKYQIAVDAGFGKFFPKTLYYGEKEDKPIYIQERMVDFYSSYHEPSEESSKRAVELNKERRIPNIWAAAVIDRYGEQELIDLMKFLRDNHMDGDLHGGNVGYRENGDPVIIDWSGWRG